LGERNFGVTVLGDTGTEVQCFWDSYTVLLLLLPSIYQPSLLYYLRTCGLKLSTVDDVVKFIIQTVEDLMLLIS